MCNATPSAASFTTLAPPMAASSFEFARRVYRGRISVCASFAYTKRPGDIRCMVCTRRVVFHARSKRFQHADDTDCDGGDWRANAVQWLQPLVARLDLQLIDGLCNRPVQGRTCFREHCALPQTIYDGDPVDCKPVHADIFVGNVYGHPRVIAGIRLGDKTHPVRRADASALPILAITLPDRTTAITNECGHHTQDIFARLRPRRQTVLDRWIVRTARRMESTFQPCSQSAASQQTRLWSMRHWTECTNCHTWECTETRQPLGDALVARGRSPLPCVCYATSVTRHIFCGCKNTNAFVFHTHVRVGWCNACTPPCTCCNRTIDSTQMTLVPRKDGACFVCVTCRQFVQ